MASVPLPSSSPPLPSRAPCPPPTITPDPNGWVPPGTCGFLSRPYYPSFSAALLFCVLAVVVQICYARRVLRGVRRREARDDEAGARSLRHPWWKEAGRALFVPCVGAALATCLLAAYVLRALGTRNMQVPVYVAASDTLVLTSPILSSSLATFILLRLAPPPPSPSPSPSTHSTPTTPPRSPRPLLLLLLLLLLPLAPLSALYLLSALLVAPKHLPTPTSPAAPTAALGLKLYILGLALHLVVLVPTIIVAIILRRQPGPLGPASVGPRGRNGRKEKKEKEKEKEKAVKAVLSALLPLFLRTLYRLVELGAFFFTTTLGWATSLARHEVYFYALECLPVLVSVSVWAFVDVDVEDDVWRGGGGGRTARHRGGYEEVNAEDEDGDEDGDEVEDEGVVLKRVDR